MEHSAMFEFGNAGPSTQNMVLSGEAKKSTVEHYKIRTKQKSLESLTENLLQVCHDQEGFAHRMPSVSARRELSSADAVLPSAIRSGQRFAASVLHGCYLLAELARCHWEPTGIDRPGLRDRPRVDVESESLGRGREHLLELVPCLDVDSEIAAGLALRLEKLEPESDLGDDLESDSWFSWALSRFARYGSGLCPSTGFPCPQESTDLERLHGDRDPSDCTPDLDPEDEFDVTLFRLPYIRGSAAARQPDLDRKSSDLDVDLDASLWADLEGFRPV